MTRFVRMDTNYYDLSCGNLSDDRIGEYRRKVKTEEYVNPIYGAEALLNDLSSKTYAVVIFPVDHPVVEKNLAKAVRDQLMKEGRK